MHTSATVHQTPSHYNCVNVTALFNGSDVTTYDGVFLEHWNTRPTTQTLLCLGDAQTTSVNPPFSQLNPTLWRMFWVLKHHQNKV